MSELIDASGLSCPQPVILTLDKIKQMGSGELEVLVDTDTSKENVSRAAISQGWEIKQVTEEGEGFRLTLVKA
ncbi:MAG: sulfurtransferase TusA family protein [Desulfarculaceae bacterium]|jgi:TusA-related sulfurtransferase